MIVQGEVGEAYVALRREDPHAAQRHRRGRRRGSPLLRHRRPTSSPANSSPSTAALAALGAALSCERSLFLASSARRSSPLPPARLLHLFATSPRGSSSTSNSLPRKTASRVRDAQGVRRSSAPNLLATRSRASRIRGGRVVVLCASVARKWTQRFSSSSQRHRSALPALVPGQRVRRHLDQHAAAQPLDQPLGLVLQRGVALRMGQDRRQPGQPQLVEGLGQPRRKPVVRHLHQQVAQPVDAEPRRVHLRQLHVVEGEMEVASQAQRQRNLLLGQPRAQLVGSWPRSRSGSKSW